MEDMLAPKFDGFPFEKSSQAESKIASTLTEFELQIDQIRIG